MHQFRGESLPLAELSDPTLRAVHDYWCRLRGERAMASRKDVAPEDMKSYLSRVMLIEVRRDPLDFVYRVYGSGIARAGGKDYTAKSARELQPAGFAELIWQQYLEVVDARAPRLHAVQLEADGRFQSYQRLTLPLSSDGVVVDRLLAVSIEDRKFWSSVAKGGMLRAGAVED